MYSKTNQKMWNIYAKVIVNYRNKIYAKYILVYIKVKIVEISKYHLSYMRYYIAIAIKEFIIIFLISKWP